MEHTNLLSWNYIVHIIVIQIYVISLILPMNFKDFKILRNKKNISRINCINLPFDAVLKALR